MDVVNISQKNIELDISSQIVEAAHARFRHYGYGKTTMAEIAADTGMSAANLYRYFKSKQDIIAECANRSMCERVVRLRAAVRKPESSAIEQLKDYVLTDLTISQEMAENDEKISELVNTITRERADLVYRKIEAETTLLAEILSHGNETGEFAIDDINKTASTIFMSLVVFNVPTFMSLYSLEEFKEKAVSVIELIVTGLVIHKQFSLQK
jgi:AcrR family transcriptional regulator